jgi:hypothetical protein
MAWPRAFRPIRSHHLRALPHAVWLPFLAVTVTCFTVFVQWLHSAPLTSSHSQSHGCNQHYCCPATANHRALLLLLNMLHSAPLLLSPSQSQGYACSVSHTAPQRCDFVLIFCDGPYCPFQVNCPLEYAAFSASQPSIRPIQSIQTVHGVPLSIEDNAANR